MIVHKITSFEFTSTTQVAEICDVVLELEEQGSKNAEELEEDNSKSEFAFGDVKSILLSANSKKVSFSAYNFLKCQFEASIFRPPQVLS